MIAIGWIDDDDDKKKGRKPLIVVVVDVAVDVVVDIVVVDIVVVDIVVVAKKLVKGQIGQEWSVIFYQIFQTSLLLSW